jgi:hypothetical protein
MIIFEKQLEILKKETIRNEKTAWPSNFRKKRLILRIYGNREQKNEVEKLQDKFTKV